MNILHKVKAWLYDNPLTDDPNDYIARVSSERSLTVREICESAVSRGGANVPAAAIEHNVDLFHKEMAYLLSDGYSINTEYYQAGVLINGVFNSVTDNFDPERHNVSFVFKQGALLRNELPSIAIDIIGAADCNSVISQVTDVKTGSVNDKLTPNRNLKIKGTKIKLAGDNAAVGLYFINQSTGESAKVDTADIVSNNPSELIIVIPLLSAGTYRLQQVTQYTGNFLLKEPRTVVFDKALTVA